MNTHRLTPEELEAIPEADSPEDVMPLPKFAPPLEAPVTISQPFGAAPEVYRIGGLAGHNGIDYEAPEGTPVYAVATGEVIHAGPGDLGRFAFLLGNSAGGAILIRHRAAGFITGYAHLSGYTVAVGDIVQEGDLIGETGATGYVGGPHLHFEVLPITGEGALDTANGYLGRVDPALVMDLTHG